MAIKASISFASEDAAAEAFEKVVKEVRESGTATLPVEGDGGPNLVLEVVDEANSEFDPPSVEIKEIPD